MTPGPESAIDTHSHDGSYRPVDNRDAVLVARDPCTLNPIQKSSKPNLRFADHTMRSQYAALYTLRVRDVRLLPIRAAVTLIGRRVAVYYLDIRNQRSDRTQYVN